MSTQQTHITAPREALRKQGFAGVALNEHISSVSELYAAVCSSTDGSGFISKAEDWATISYVHTNSAHGSDGMPEWVAEDVESVLDGLTQTKFLSHRAVWFDQLGAIQHRDWPILANMHCLAAPVICVPPTRTIEYSRYQIPDRWDVPTFNFFENVECTLRMCSSCGPKSPLEFDSRLLNIAACLRAWQMNEATIGASARGCFVSFATIDRLQFTIAWYQVLLQVALDLSGYGSELFARSVELYGPALFQPCLRCLNTIREHCYDNEKVASYHVLDDTLASLVMQANRFVLPWARDHEGKEIWALDGLQRSPGEKMLSKRTNSQRLKLLMSRRNLSQKRYEEIAGNIVRGRPALSSCFRDGDKWLCAIILSNIQKMVDVFALSAEDSASSVLHEKLKSTLLALFKLGKTFGDMCYRHSLMEVDLNIGYRSPTCSGQRGSICFLNELSGILKPSSVGEFITDRGFEDIEQLDILKLAEAGLRKKLLAQGIALVGYEFGYHAVHELGRGYCGSCFKADPDLEELRSKVLLIGWKAKDTGDDIFERESEQLPDNDAVYSFVVVGVDVSGHVRSRGIFSAAHSRRCHRCTSSYIRISMEGTNDLLEIHVTKTVPIASALDTVYESVHRHHMM
ncbi:hypothetical protein FGB62_4g112 [Gracilaria domingensis]|nr:hypothetical protein FGB62_4g112 [Gracilaria domingensis]